jgi:hypothetical protein
VLSDTARHCTLRSPKDKARHETKYSISKGRTLCGNPAYNANRIIALPKNFLRLIASERATAIMGNWMSCSTKIYNLFPGSNKSNFSQINRGRFGWSAPDHLGDYGHDQFVGRRGEKKGGQHGTRARKLVRADCQRVGLSKQDIFYGLV